MKTLKFFLFAMLALSMACSGDDLKETPLPPVLTVVDFNVPAGCGINYSKMQHDSVYVINSEEEWANIFTCESNPQIDFSTKTLLVAFGAAVSGIGNISKKLLFEDNVYSLTVDITLGLTAHPEGWHIVLITDKINTQSVVLNFHQFVGNEPEDTNNNNEQSDFAYKKFIIDQLACMNMPRPADSYNYPVYPGMEEWASFKTTKEMIDACQIPVEVLENMSTQAVIQAIWEYPFFIDVIHRYEYQLDFESVFGSNNAYLELIQRQDAGVMLLERLQQVNPVYSNRLFEPHALEILMSQTVFLLQLEDTGKKKIIELTLRNDDLRKHDEAGTYSFRSTAWLLIARTLFVCNYAPFLQEVDSNRQLKSFLEDKMHVYLENAVDEIPSFIMECAENYLLNK